jgi:hypothetical protein
VPRAYTRGYLLSAAPPFQAAVIACPLLWKKRETPDFLDVFAEFTRLTPLGRPTCGCNP